MTNFDKYMLSLLRNVDRCGYTDEEFIKSLRRNWWYLGNIKDEEKMFDDIMKSERSPMEIADQLHAVTCDLLALLHGVETIKDLERLCEK